MRVRILDDKINAYKEMKISDPIDVLNRGDLVNIKKTIIKEGTIWRKIKRKGKVDCYIKNSQIFKLISVKLTQKSVQVYEDSDSKSKVVDIIYKDSCLNLTDYLNDNNSGFYKAKTDNGTTGWVEQDILYKELKGKFDKTLIGKPIDIGILIILVVGLNILDRNHGFFQVNTINGLLRLLIIIAIFKVLQYYYRKKKRGLRLNSN